MNLFSGSYDPADVTFLLKRVRMMPTPVQEKEHLIQTGRRHYSEMIAPEKLPSEVYLRLYRDALAANGPRLAADVAALARALDDRAPKGREIVLVSLARAGTPIGVLLRRALRRAERNVPHYSISIIRDRGLDAVALAHILRQHAAADLVFVDGWTGKGVIANELRASFGGLGYGSAFLTVVADPAGRADLAASGDDYVIASGLLNGVVSGLVSRSILNPALVGPGDFHACVFHPEWARFDLSRSFVDTLDGLAAAPGARTADWSPRRRSKAASASDRAVEALLELTGTTDRNRLKPGIAEATRAVLRRAPDRVLVADPDAPEVRHLVHLAHERGVTVEHLPFPGPYRAAAVIRLIGDV